MFRTHSFQDMSEKDLGAGSLAAYVLSMVKYHDLKEAGKEDQGDDGQETVTDEVCDLVRMRCECSLLYRRLDEITQCPEQVSGGPPYDRAPLPLCPTTASTLRQLRHPISFRCRLPTPRESIASRAFMASPEEPMVSTKAKITSCGLYPNSRLQAVTAAKQARTTSLIGWATTRHWLIWVVATARLRV